MQIAIAVQRRKHNIGKQVNVKSHLEGKGKCFVLEVDVDNLVLYCIDDE